MQVSVHKSDICDITSRSLSQFTGSIYTVWTGNVPTPILSSDSQFVQMPCCLGWKPIEHKCRDLFPKLWPCLHAKPVQPSPRRARSRQQQRRVPGQQLRPGAGPRLPWEQLQGPSYLRLPQLPRQHCRWREVRLSRLNSAFVSQTQTLAGMGAVSNKSLQWLAWRTITACTDASPKTEAMTLFLTLLAGVRLRQNLDEWNANRSTMVVQGLACTHSISSYYKVESTSKDQQ